VTFQERKQPTGSQKPLNLFSGCSWATTEDLGSMLSVDALMMPTLIWQAKL
jgi:hypothetical protein